jgi:SPX domain protein involved in polyphosphate accumulation
VNIYFDTDDYELIRTSLEKPVYKEKLRLRSYGVPKETDTVFVEIKKKYDGLVGKRRIGLPMRKARNYLEHGIHPGRQTPRSAARSTGSSPGTG